MKSLVHGMGGLLQRAEAALVALAAERRCAMRLEQIGQRLRLMGDKISLLRSRMREEVMDEPIDPDFCLRESLKGLKEDIRDIRRQLATLQGPQLSARLQRAFARLTKIAEETYASADGLHWEIGEHDQRWPVQLVPVSE